MLTRLLETAEDIIPLGKSQSDPSKVRFACPFQGEVAEHYVDNIPEVKII